MKIALTFDTDWVNEIAIEYVVNLLDKYDQRGTFFSTNKYQIFLKKGFKHEIGLHPNFNNLLSKGDSNYEDIINNLHKIYPKAKGFRSHSLTSSSHILNYFKSLSFEYDSNLYNPNPSKPYKDFSGLIRFSHNYVDHGHLIENKELSIENIRLSNSELNVLDFHPIHIFINTPTLEYYKKYKHLTKSKNIKDVRNNRVKGIGDLFCELLNYLKTNSIKTQTLISIILKC